MDGWKTKGAVIVGFLVATNHLLRAFDVVFLSQTAENAVLELAVALGLWGVGHKLDKVKRALLGIREDEEDLLPLNPDRHL